MTAKGEVRQKMTHYKKIPDDILKLLQEYKAAPRLQAHLTLVYNVAGELAVRLNEKFPGLKFDYQRVLSGAAIHDIGKVLITRELSVSGNSHEEAGYQLLLEQGFEDEIAVFARDHSNWTSDSPIEILIVAISDTIWKGKRDSELEQLILTQICFHSDLDKWEAYIVFDEMLEKLADKGDERLAFQISYPL